jgi:L-fuconolactonase
LRIDSHHAFSERYTLEYLGTILKRNRFEGSVLIAPDIADFPEFVRGVVVQADPDDPRFPYLLDQYQRDRRFRGVCHRFSEGIPDGLAELERRGITLDALAAPALIVRIVDRFPSLRIVIDHVGQADVAELTGDEWARDLAQVAQSPQVFCKLSGVARLVPAPRTCVQYALTVFGPQRLMFGSDWPEGLPDVTWKASLAAFTQAIGPQTIEVREELLGGTAERFYGL